MHLARLSLSFLSRLPLGVSLQLVAWLAQQLESVHLAEHSLYELWQFLIATERTCWFYVIYLGILSTEHLLAVSTLVLVVSHFSVELALMLRSPSLEGSSQC